MASCPLVLGERSLRLALRTPTLLLRFDDTSVDRVRNTALRLSRHLQASEASPLDDLLVELVALFHDMAGQSKSGHRSFWRLLNWSLADDR